VWKPTRTYLFLGPEKHSVSLGTNGSPDTTSPLEYQIFLTLPFLFLTLLLLHEYFANASIANFS